MLLLAWDEPILSSLSLSPFLPSSPPPSLSKLAAQATESEPPKVMNVEVGETQEVPLPLNGSQPRQYNLKWDELREPSRTFQKAPLEGSPDWWPDS